jgi:hypothetical protein
VPFGTCTLFFLAISVTSIFRTAWAIPAAGSVHPHGPKPSERTYGHVTQKDNIISDDFLGVKV